jgi:nucleoid DNA-binding protein
MKNSINTTELISEVSSQTGFHPDTVRQITNCWLENVMGRLENGISVRLRGFGSFVIIRSKRKKMFNRWKGMVVSIPPKDRVRFRAAFEVEP